MVLEYYNLREQPFGVTPDPQYLYYSATHREALASLLYGLEAGRGFVALIAKPGMGKTTLLFQALNQLKDRTRAVFVFQTICTPIELLRAVLADLGVHDTQGNLIELQAKLNEVITEQSRLGKRLVIVIDEAQNLDDSVLEMVRMLSNFETSREKLIQIVLCGQPQLADRLSSPGLVQLRQRISIFGRLKPFSSEETTRYVDHRIRMTGYSAETPLFTRDALALIAQCSEGIPRNINNLCFNALSLGRALRRRPIDCDIVREVVADLNLEPLRESTALVSRSKEDSAFREVVPDFGLKPLQEWKPISAQVEKDDTPGVPAFASVAGSPSMRTGWLSKLAVACAILLAAGGALYQSHQWIMPKVVAGANRVVPSLVAVNPPSFHVEQTPQQTAPTGVVLVAPGQSLYRICAETVGNCTSEMLHEIHKLNPWLSNPDHIEAGQKIRAPFASDLSAATQGVVELSGSAGPAKKDAQ